MNESNLNNSDSIRFRNYHVTLHKFPKKDIFVLAKIEKLHYTKSHKFPKKGIFFTNHFRIRFDLTQFDSIRFDLTQFDSNRFDSIWIRFRFGQFGFDLNSIQFGLNRISSIRIRFADHEFESNPNRIRIRIRIWFDSTNRLRNPNVNTNCYLVILCEKKFNSKKILNHKFWNTI